MVGNLHLALYCDLYLDTLPVQYHLIHKPLHLHLVLTNSFAVLIMEICKLVNWVSGSGK